MPEELSVGPKDLEWLAVALKLDKVNLTGPESLQGGLPSLSLQSWPEGEKVLEEGARGRDFYVVREGSLVVWREAGQSAPKRLGILKSGDFFGELGFLLGSARSATVRAETKCTLFRFLAPEFSTLLQRQKLLEGWIKRVASERLKSLFGR